MPKLWNNTIEGHRRAVRDATLDATAALVAEQGLASVTMSEIAKQTGIGRATLYKYFPDVESILMAWHQRQVAAHLQHLSRIREHAGTLGQRLEAVLQAFALMSHRHHDADLAGLLHRGEHVVRGQQQLHDFLHTLLAEGVQSGEVRADVEPADLASYCLHALTAASSLPSTAAVQRLVSVTLAGLRPPT